jgi:hypothetical protein
MPAGSVPLDRICLQLKRWKLHCFGGAWGEQILRRPQRSAHAQGCGSKAHCPGG